ncbi:serine/threonine protein kinase [Paracoccus sp. 11-3]|uniref:Serine/threonine protein kinase n=1 Tax=Paracoccus amoyensis TaxID=2760093 RepID=A0A926GGB7_9RHOB|nr:serine/threonine-protein kinase [Paracoccus amoyensis]MBC9246829.1 serine/threonine protein kinase [Paracoccus amoyensis]
MSDPEDGDEGKPAVGRDKKPNPLTTPPDGSAQEAPDRTVIAEIEDDAAEALVSASDMEGAERTVIALDGERTPLPVADPTVVSEQPNAASAPVRLVEPGTLINNNYRIIELISAGGMGEVYRAANVFTGDFVAVKVILGNLANDETVLNMFRREARVLVQLRHDAIVRYHNFVLDGGLQRYCLIMEYVEGRHLGTRVKNYGPLPDQAILALIRRLASGLARAHASGVTHRDLSPDNVILRDDRVEEAVLIDFGIARSTELGDGLAGRFAGKFKYIAPEQLGHWDGVIGPQTDVYGLGLLAAMVARGTPLDMGDSVVSASAARQTIPSLDGLSHRLFPLLQHMLEPDPAKRPTDMNAVLQILDDPQQLPAQYRLPLWSSGSATDLQGDAGASGLDTRGSGGRQTGSLTSNDLSELTSSHSPFGALSGPEPTVQAQPAEAVNRFHAGLYCWLARL